MTNYSENPVFPDPRMSWDEVFEQLNLRFNDLSRSEKKNGYKFLLANEENAIGKIGTEFKEVFKDASDEELKDLALSAASLRSKNACYSIISNPVTFQEILKEEPNEAAKGLAMRYEHALSNPARIEGVKGMLDNFAQDKYKRKVFIIGLPDETDEMLIAFGNGGHGDLRKELETQGLKFDSVGLTGGIVGLDEPETIELYGYSGDFGKFPEKVVGKFSGDIEKAFAEINGLEPKVEITRRRE